MDDIDTASLQKLEEMLQQSADPSKMPSRKEVLQMLESADITDEMKEGIRGLLAGDAPKLFGGYGEGTALGIVFVFVIFAIIYAAVEDFYEINTMAELPAEGINMGLGNAIKEKLTETIRNADILSILQKIVAVTPEDEESEEIRSKIQGVLAQYDAMTDTEKTHFAAQLKDALATKLSMKLKDQNIDFSGVEEAIGQAVMYNLALIAAAVVLILIVLVFFGYKLYKSITDKEKKREEKKKAKQMKKKK